MYGEAAVVQAAEKVTEVQAAAAAEDREAETLAWSPPVTLSATPVAYVCSVVGGRSVTLTGRVLESRIESYNVRTQSTRLQCCYEANKVWSG